jgi:hypothetical protein
MPTTTAPAPTTAARETGHVLLVERPNDGRLGLVLTATIWGESAPYASLLLTEDGDLDLALEFLDLEASWHSMTPIDAGPGFVLLASERI